MSENFPGLSPRDLIHFLMQVAVHRPVFVWGKSGIGKSAIIEQFSSKMGLECVTLLSSQVSAEDIMGIPQIVDGNFQFCPPRLIVREKPYCLFLDELNQCKPEVQQAFYSVIYDGRIGEYRLPQGSIVIGGGSLDQKGNFVGISGNLMNRMVNACLTVSTETWLEWAEINQIHKAVLQYIQQYPEDLFDQRDATLSNPHSTPRSWHMLSDVIKGLNGIRSEEEMQYLAAGCVSLDHAKRFSKYFNYRLRMVEFKNANAPAGDQF